MFLELSNVLFFCFLIACIGRRGGSGAFTIVRWFVSERLACPAPGGGDDTMLICLGCSREGVPAHATPRPATPRPSRVARHASARSARPAVLPRTDRNSAQTAVPNYEYFSRDTAGHRCRLAAPGLGALVAIIIVRLAVGGARRARSKNQYD